MKDGSIFYRCVQCGANMLQTEKDDHFCQDYKIERWAWMNMSFEKQQETIKKIYAKPHTRLNLVAPDDDSFSKTVTYTRKEWSRFSKEIQEKLINRSSFYEGEIILTGLTRKQEVKKRIIDFMLKRESKEKKAEKIQKKLLEKKTKKPRKISKRKKRIMDTIADQITPTKKKTRKGFF